MITLMASSFGLHHAVIFAFRELIRRQPAAALPDYAMPAFSMS